MIWILLLLQGCSVYVAAEHKSEPHIDRDGLDMACAGFKHDGQFEAKLGYCKDVTIGSGLIEARIEYDWEIF